MTDKNLVKSRFGANYKTYNDNAVVQKMVVSNLTKLIPYIQYENVLEIGCGTGFLTAKLDYLNAKKLFINDLSEEVIHYVVVRNVLHEFLIGDAEKICFPKNLDLIVSSNAVQWFEDLDAFFARSAAALNEKGKLIFSTFVLGNFKEIAEIFDYSLNYKTQDEIMSCAKKYFEIKFANVENIPLYFDNLTELLRHIKNTGVNAVGQFKLTKSRFFEAQKKYENLRTSNGLPLTYCPAYFVLGKK